MRKSTGMFDCNGTEIFEGDIVRGYLTCSEFLGTNYLPTIVELPPKIGIVCITQYGTLLSTDFNCNLEVQDGIPLDAFDRLLVVEKGEKNMSTRMMEIGNIKSIISNLCAKRNCKLTEEDMLELAVALYDVVYRKVIDGNFDEDKGE